MPPRRQPAQPQPQQQRVEEVYERDDLRRLEQRFEQRIEQMEQRMDVFMDRLTDRMGELFVNQHRANPNHRRNTNFDEQRNSFARGNNNGDVSDDEEEEEYYEESLFIDTDDGEDEDAVIGDEPIFDEDDDDWLHNNIFSDSQDTTSYEIEAVQALGPETKEHPKHQNNMPKSSEHGDFINFIGIDKIFYSYIPLNLILKELRADEFMISNAFMGKFLFQ